MIDSQMHGGDLHVSTHPDDRALHNTRRHVVRRMLTRHAHERGIPDSELADALAALDLTEDQ